MTAASQAAIKRRLEAAALACSQRGSRLTLLRRAVLELILNAEGPVTAYQLLDQLKKKHKGAAPPTIYRALDFLLDNELIHKVESLSAFIPCIDAGNHSLSVQLPNSRSRRFRRRSTGPPRGKVFDPAARSSKSRESARLARPRRPERGPFAPLPWSIFRRSGHRFGAESATRPRNPEHVPMPLDRNMLWYSAPTLWRCAAA